MKSFAGSAGDWASSGLGLLSILMALGMFVILVVRPLAFSAEKVALDKPTIDIVRTDQHHAAIRLPAVEGQAMRFVHVDIPMTLPPRQSLPLRIEIRGGSPDGRLLASRHWWNPGPQRQAANAQFTFFTWFYGTSYAVFVAPPDSAGIDVGHIGIEDYLQKLLSTHTEIAYLLIWTAAFLFIVLVPGAALFVLAGKTLRDRLSESWPAHAAHVVLAAVVGLSIAQAWHAIDTVFLPAYSYCNGSWNIPQLAPLIDNDTFLPEITSYSPGQPLFYFLIIKALTGIGFDAGGPFVTEVGYRLVQFAFALSANVLLFFYLVKMWKRLHLPGVHFFPLIPVSILSLHPELVFSYLSVNVHTGMLFPVFIVLWVLSYRLVYETRSWTGIVLLGLACSFAFLWRNEFILVPAAVVVLLLFAMGIDRRSIVVAAKILLVAAIVPVSFMGKNYVEAGKFATHDTSQAAIGLSIFTGMGYRENAGGFLFNDCYTHTVARRTAPDIRIGREEKLANALRLHRNYVANHPMEFARSALHRMPANIYSLVSEVVPGCSDAVDRVAQFVWNGKDIIWLVLLFNLPLLPFAFLKGSKDIAFVALPAVYGLCLVGAVGSGTGYFAYALLTFVVTFAIGLAAAFHWAAAAIGRLARIPSPDTSGVEASTLHQKAFFGVVSTASFVLLAISAWQGVIGYSPLTRLIDGPMDLTGEAVSRAVLDHNVKNESVRIAWGVDAAPVSMPFYDGHLIEVDGEVLVQSFRGNEYLFRFLDVGSGVEKRSTAVSAPLWCFRGYFTKRGRYLYTEGFGTGDGASLQRIDLLGSENRRGVDFDGYVFAPLLVDERRVFYQTSSVGSMPLSRFTDPDGTDEGRWQFSEKPVAGELAQDSCCLYFGSTQDGTYFALRKDDGSVKWRFTGKANVSIKPYVTGGSVIFVDAVGNIYELDSDTGKLLRDASLSGTFYADIEHRRGVVYAGNLAGELSAIDLASGKTRWRTTGKGAVLAKPLLVGAYIYAGFGRWLSKLDAATGRVVWEMDLGYVVRDTPLILRDKILVRTNRYLFALEEG